MGTEQERPRRRRLWPRIAAVAGVLVVALVLGVVAWSLTGVATAEPEPLAAVRADPSIRTTVTDAAFVMEPAPAEGAGRTGLVFIPGGKVEAEAYAARLSRLVTEEGLTVVITKPVLNLAFFDLRGLDSFTDLAPDVDRWIVGGHSLGGVRACSLAADAQGLLLLASYCGADLSDTEVPVLSIAGENDGLSTPEAVAEASHRLPEGTRFVTVPGANHASFGDYGAQDGDGVASIDDAEMTARVTELVAEFVGSW